MKYACSCVLLFLSSRSGSIGLHSMKWGLFDLIGNVFEYCEGVPGDLEMRPNAKPVVRRLSTSKLVVFIVAFRGEA